MNPSPPPAHYFSIGAMSQLVDVSLVRISPDGSRVAFVASRADMPHNRYVDELEIYDRAARSLHRVARTHHSINALQWNPRAGVLAAIMDDPKTKEDQIYTIDPSSGAERRVTRGSTGAVDFAWSPDGSRIAFTRSRPVARKTGAAAYRDAFEVTDNAYLVTSAPQPDRLWVTGLHGGARQITRGASGVVDSALSWSPDGRYVLYESASPVYGLQDRAVAMRVDVATGISTPAAGNHPYADQALYSPDGARIAYRYPRDGDEANQADAYAVSATGGGVTDLSRALDRHVSTLAWMPDSSALLLAVYDSAQDPLYVQPLHGAARRLPLGNVRAASIDPQGSVARDGTIAFAGTQPMRPPEVYVLAPGASSPVRITNLNGATAALPLARQTRITWTGPQGMLEDGVLTYPPGYRAGRRYPLVLRIHGGPTESSTIAFDPFYQLAAARGYLVFAPNYRGSNDLGNAYERAIFNDPSIGPGKDIMAGIHAVERLGIVDTRRIGVSGWSYGGQLTSWMEGHYQIWRAAVAGAAVNDLVVDYAIADDIDADKVMFSGGSPYRGDDLARWREHSPITYFKDIRTPTLILCNVYDVRVPIVESYEMYHALRDRGVPVRFYAYPSTGHLPKGPVRLADAYERWLGWFDRYLR